MGPPVCAPTLSGRNGAHACSPAPPSLATCRCQPHAAGCWPPARTPFRSRRVSDSKKKKAAIKRGGSKASLKSTASNSALSEVGGGAGLDDGLTAALEEFELNDRSTTCILTSHPQSRDIQFESFSLIYHGHELLSDTKLEMNYGR